MSVRVTHGGCGSVSVEAGDFLLNVSERAPELSHYIFTCPACGERVRKTADSNVLRMLTGGAGGVVRTRWEPPAEALEPHPAATGEPMTLDDCITFHEEIVATDDGCLARWAA
jgi:hypothetical protein